MLRKQIARFLIVGVVNTAFGYGLYVFFIYLNFHYSLAVLLSTVLGILFNFKTIGKFVFASNDNRLIGKFFATYFLTFFINIWLISKLKDLDFDYYIAGFLSISLTSVLSFVLTKYLVFKK